MHFVLHEVVANQLWDADPPEVGDTADRLRRLGSERHEVLHMLATVAAEEMFWTARRNAPFDAAERRGLLDELPASWLASDAPDDEADEGDGPYDDGDPPDDEDDDESLRALLATARRLLDERGRLMPSGVAAALDEDEDDLDEILEDPPGLRRGWPARLR